MLLKCVDGLKPFNWCTHVTNFIHDIAKDENDKTNEMHNINNTKKEYETQSPFNDLQREASNHNIRKKGIMSQDWAKPTKTTVSWIWLGKAWKKQQIFYGQADPKGGGGGVSPLGPDRKQMWSFLQLKFDSLTLNTHFSCPFRGC